ncbi:MAG: glucosidase [Bdellovibrionota bacterium]
MATKKTDSPKQTAEELRVLAAEAEKEKWMLFGPYLSERAWATVREDYSANGDAWTYFPHEHARYKAYRWGEDGIGGISDDKQMLCFAPAFWNERDPILKERMFGLTGAEGNHGEDAKEVWFYLDSTPTHSYLKMNYKYPHAEFPYQRLIDENRRRNRLEPEFELWDSGAFHENRYFDCYVEYAKASPDDILCKITVHNMGPEAAKIHILPTLWFRNTWSWGRNTSKPTMKFDQNAYAEFVQAVHHDLGTYVLYADSPQSWMFTENETNNEHLYGTPNASPYTKDAFHRAIVSHNSGAVNPNMEGTKAAAHFHQLLHPGERYEVRLRLVGPRSKQPQRAFADFDKIFDQRLKEADEFYHSVEPEAMTADERLVQRQALAGMMWAKQFFYYVVEDWLKGDPVGPPPPKSRLNARNAEWKHLYNERVMSMPDPWEYPWYAAWDLAFHCIPIALIDPAFAKGQLDLLTREWYQHPNGQIPAYEWNFSDVNPPVFAWAAWRIYKMEERQRGKGDAAFLETIFHKLMLNFTWWVNRKDSEGRNIFQGGFLGLDNIGVFDRSAPLPTGGFLEQSDGTSWMGMFSLNMMKIALELARKNPVYENIATKFLEHFLGIAHALNSLELWDEQDKFFYDGLHLPTGEHIPLRIRSLVGLMPLLAVETLEPQELEELPGFKKRLEWYLNYREDLTKLVSRWEVPGSGARRLIALVRGSRMKSLLRRMLDQNEFLSPHGIRSVSKYHSEHPYSFYTQGAEYRVSYEPGEGETPLFGGNSNWRGPVWFPINYLLIESLQKFHYYYGDDFKVECPTGSGNFLTLDQIADELSKRMNNLFLKNEEGWRPFQGRDRGIFSKPDWRDHIWFHEYFHGDHGSGLGACHQTGWTGLAAKLLHQQASKRK